MRLCRIVALALAAHLSYCGSALAGSLAGRFHVFLQDGLAPLADSFANAVGRSIPVLAVSPAYHYEFDPETGTYTRGEATGGQLFIEHAEPLGAGHVALDAYYLHVQFDELDGRSLRELGDPFSRVTRLGGTDVPLFRIPLAAVDTSAEEVFFSATYGVLSWLDLNVALPFVYTRLSREDRIEGPANDGAPLGATVTGSSRDTASGIGDLQLRAKARVGSLGPLEIATELAVRVPTGDEEDFQGTGDVEVTPTLIVSTPQWTAAPGVSLQAHLNLAMLVDVDETEDRSEGRWGVGIDLGSTRWQLAVGLQGRHPTGPIFSAEQIDALTAPFCLASRRRCLSTDRQLPVGDHTLFGFSSSRPSYLDGSIGIRVGLWSGRVSAVVGMLAPLLDEGLTTDPIPVAGLEAAF